jgi:hypothetical protein
MGRHACGMTRLASALNDTPARGFTGSDLFVFEVAEPDGRQRIYRVALTVR